MKLLWTSVKIESCNQAKRRLSTNLIYLKLGFFEIIIMKLYASAFSSGTLTTPTSYAPKPSIFGTDVKKTSYPQAAI